MEANNDPALVIRIARSDAMFLHDTLMACAFQGAQMLQAADLINGFARALAAPEPAAKQAPQKKPDAAKGEPAAPAPKELLRDVPPVPAPAAPRALSGGKKRKR